MQSFPFLFLVYQTKPVFVVPSHRVKFQGCQVTPAPYFGGTPHHQHAHPTRLIPIDLPCLRAHALAHRFGSCLLAFAAALRGSTCRHWRGPDQPVAPCSQGCGCLCAQDNPTVAFHLHSQKFLELVAQHAVVDAVHYAQTHLAPFRGLDPQFETVLQVRL